MIKRNVVFSLIWPAVSGVILGLAWWLRPFASGNVSGILFGGFLVVMFSGSVADRWYRWHSEHKLGLSGFHCPVCKSKKATANDRFWEYALKNGRCAHCGCRLIFRDEADIGL